MGPCAGPGSGERETGEWDRRPLSQAANFGALSEKALPFCTDFAHYCPINNGWRPVARAIHVTATGKKSMWKTGGAEAANIKVARR